MSLFIIRNESKFSNINYIKMQNSYIQNIDIINGSYFYNDNNKDNIFKKKQKKY